MLVLLRERGALEAAHARELAARDEQAAAATAALEQQLAELIARQQEVRTLGGAARAGGAVCRRLLCMRCWQFAPSAAHAWLSPLLHTISPGGGTRAAGGCAAGRRTCGVVRRPCHF